jgi:hypothetical protein
LDSPEIFHWQTQNNAEPDAPAGRRRYIESARRAAAPSDLVRADVSQKMLFRDTFS